MNYPKMIYDAQLLNTISPNVNKLEKEYFIGMWLAPVFKEFMNDLADIMINCNFDKSQMVRYKVIVHCQDHEDK